VSRNGGLVNPLAEKFAAGEPIPAAQRASFIARAGELLGRLERAAKPGTPPRGEAAESVPVDRASQRP